MASAGKNVVLVVENLSVPFDKRVWREAKVLKENGFNVDVICPKGFNRDEEKFIELESIKIHRYKAPIFSEGKLGYVYEYFNAFLKTSLILTKLRFKHKIHVIHVANPPEIFFPYGFFRKLFGYKFIFDHHDLSPESFLFKFKKNKNDFVYKMLLLCEKLTVKYSDIIISTNESLKKIVNERYNYPLEKIFVVRNGPDKHVVRTSPDESFKSGKKYLAGYIGVMGVTDGVENIVYAADELVNKKKITEVKFILIGHGDAYEKVTQLTKELKLDEFIHLTGRLPDAEVYKILSSCDVFLAPDPANGLNEYHTMNKIMDYMMFGKPIISFDLFETSVTAGDAAVYVKNNDCAEFAKQIELILADKEKSTAMVQVGTERVKNLVWEKTSLNLIQGYKSLFNL